MHYYCCINSDTSAVKSHLFPTSLSIKNIKNMVLYLRGVVVEEDNRGQKREMERESKKAKRFWGNFPSFLLLLHHQRFLRFFVMGDSSVSCGDNGHNLLLLLMLEAETVIIRQRFLRFS